MLQALRADEGLDERLAVGIGITLRGDEAGEDGRAGDEGRNVSERIKRFPSFYQQIQYLTFSKTVFRTLWKKKAYITCEEFRTILMSDKRSVLK